MAIEDFLYESITEGEFDFDFYILYLQRECDDPYYPPYKDDIGMYKSKEKAIEDARKKFYKRAKDYVTPEARKYGGVSELYYIEGGYFQDNESRLDENGVKKKRKFIDKPLYIIYDKEEQNKVGARWERMHGRKS